MKKLFALALALIMLLGVLSTVPVMAADTAQSSYNDVVTMTTLYNGNKTVVAGTVYSISSVEELFYFAELCNHANMYFENATVILTQNIVMNEGWTASATAPTGENAKTWSPIDMFKGTLDGCNYTISGFYSPVGKNWKGVKYDAEGNTVGGTENAGGVFCTVGGETTCIKNLNINNSYFCSTAYAAALIGWVTSKTSNKGLTIKNVNIDAIVECASSTAGGFISGTHGTNRADVVYMKDCTFSGSITSGHKMGGMVGMAYMLVNFENCVNNASFICTSSQSEVCVGGMVGQINATGGNLLLENCENNGDISCTGAPAKLYVGGLVGLFNRPAEFTNCVNTGDITIKNATSEMFAGGILGYANPAASIENGISTGNITVTDVPSASSVKRHIGGIAGRFNNASATYSVTKCVSSGNVSVACASGTNYGIHTVIGGLVGYADAATMILNFTDCVSAGALTTGNNASGGLVGAYTGKEAKFERCIFSGTTTIVSAYTGAFIGCAHFADNTATDKTIAFTDSYHNKTYGNTLGSYFSTAGRKWNVTVNVAGKTSENLILTTTAGVVDNRNAINTPFDTMGCTAFSAAQLTDLNAIQNLTAYDWANVTDNGWKLEKVDGQNIPMPTAVAELIAEEVVEKDNGVDYKGVQVATDKGAVRFVATVDDLDRDNIGFEVLVIKNGAHATYTLETDTVYTSLLYNDLTKPEGEQSTEYSVDGKFLCALAFTDIPASGTVTFVVKTFTETEGVRTYDDTRVVSVNNGNVYTYIR